VILEYFTTETMELVDLGDSAAANIGIFVGGAFAMDMVIMELPAELNLVPNMYNHTCCPDLPCHLM
jgi:hypothetical protein